MSHVAAMRRLALRAGLVAALLVGARAAGEVATDFANPFMGDADAIAEGRRIYRSKCIICHGRVGGRGPNLFALDIAPARFLATVTKGRPGTLMPAFGARLSEDEILKLHAFITASERY